MMPDTGNRLPFDGETPDQLPLADELRTASGVGAAPADGPPETEDSTAAMYARARQSAEGGETREAIAIYRLLLAREPRHIRARNNLALLLEKSGDVDGALSELGKALSFDGDNVSVLCNRAAIYTARLKYDQAETDLTRAARIDERNPEVLMNLGILLCKRARWREAIEPLEQAAHLEPAGASARYYLGEAYNHIDQLPAALAAYEAAAALQPTNWRAFKGVGMVLDRMGRPAEATLAYQRSREIQRR